MTDDEYGVLLLRPLDVAPAGPPQIDVARAMREGRRMRRRRWAFGGGFLAAFTAALVTGSLLIAPATPRKPVLPPDPPLPKSCALAKLPTGKYSSVQMGGGDPTGRWLYGMTNPVVDTGPMRYLIWHDGVPVGDVAIPGEQLDLRGINSSGVIVGQAQDNKKKIWPYAYRNGKFSRLKGGPGTAEGINDRGVIVGALGDLDKAVPVRWRSPDAEPERLPIPAGTHVVSTNLAVAPDGTIAGRVESPGHVRVLPSAPPYFEASPAFLWLPDGGVRELHPPPPAEDPTTPVSPLLFRSGWLYAQQQIPVRSNGIIAIARTLLLRYDPVSGVWQQLSDGKSRPAPQLPSSARSDFRFGSATPQIYVGPHALRLPLTQPIADPEVDYATVASVSDDVHTVTGDLVSGDNDPKQPFRPVSWHCE